MGALWRFEWVGLWVVCKILSLLVHLKARRTILLVAVKISAGEASMLVSLFNLSGWDCG
jgi:hypothetical protein